MNTHLFLQGPHGPFFRRLGRALARQGDAVIRVNCCGGGDVVVSVFYFLLPPSHNKDVF